MAINEMVSSTMQMVFGVVTPLFFGIIIIGVFAVIIFGIKWWRSWNIGVEFLIDSNTTAQDSAKIKVYRNGFEEIKFKKYKWLSLQPPNYECFIRDVSGKRKLKILKLNDMDLSILQVNNSIFSDLKNIIIKNKKKEEEAKMKIEENAENFVILPRKIVSQTFEEFEIIFKKTFKPTPVSTKNWLILKQKQLRTQFNFLDIIEKYQHIIAVGIIALVVIVAVYLVINFASDKVTEILGYGASQTAKVIGLGGSPPAGL